MSCKKGILIIISAFGGTGKGTIIRELIKDEKFVLSISATSRQMRDEDVEGKTYYFKTKEEFEKMIEKNEFLEWVQFCDNYYGTPKFHIDDRLNEGKNVILELESVGAMNVKSMIKDAVTIFILPPSIEELKKRLRSRNENNDFIVQRLTKAKEEVNNAYNYDYIIENDGLSEAIKQIKDIVKVNNMKVNNQVMKLDNIKEELEKC